MIPDPGFAPAKVNLCLRVLGRRPDGFHELDSLAVFADIGDRLQAEPHGALSLAVRGPFGAVLDAGPGNLVLRAAEALRGAAGISAGARLVLDKRLPVASGIGGGSADAAASLRVLSALWGVRPEADALAALALGLGADVPVCLHRRASRMRGLGEILSPVPALPPCGLLLANPGVAVSTPAVFRLRAEAGAAFSVPVSYPDGWDDARALADWLRPLGNDLQDAAIALCPAIESLLARLGGLPGCRLARMSGSGATCFALFDSPEAAEHAVQRLDVAVPWRWGGGLSAPV